MITRSTGIVPNIPWAGPLPGGGYTGKTPELDAAVVQCAELLEKEFPLVDVEIRFNADQLGGGAWIPAGSREQSGIGACLVAGRSNFAKRMRVKPGGVVYTVFILAEHLTACELMPPSFWGDGQVGKYAYHYCTSAKEAMDSLRANLKKGAIK